MNDVRGRDLQLPVQSVPITTKVACSNPIHGKVYSILSLSVTCNGLAVSSTNKTDRHYISEILLKVALNTINKTKPIMCVYIK